MLTRATRSPSTVAGLLAAMLLVTACGSAQPSATGQPVPVGSGASAGLIPPVGGFTYVPAGTSVSIFEDAAAETLEGDPQVEILQAATAVRGDDEVLVIAFGFPGASDPESVDAMARILDGLEDGFQAGSERGLGGDAFVIQAENQTVIMGPWGRTDHLVFLFTLGPDQATRDLASAILGAG